MQIKAGYFEREAKLNLLTWVVILLIGIIAAFLGSCIIKLLK